MLVKNHNTLVSVEGLASGYLYQKQIERTQKLRKELEECKEQMKNK